ncbi:hypothetical protein QWZ10_16270 [Paracoccus cavernae]|uniref:Uncharacterized protein n=1 Tax=Paracoccus cavernae TaxID=1571207 RepID=A0ABT8D805_9RHOB|nr:hypothetical protein [Paracoccus cavernae]
MKLRCNPIGTMLTWYGHQLNTAPENLKPLAVFTFEMAHATRRVAASQETRNSTLDLLQVIAPKTMPMPDLCRHLGCDLVAIVVAVVREAAKTTEMTFEPGFKICAGISRVKESDLGKRDERHVIELFLDKLLPSARATSAPYSTLFAWDL